MDPWAWAHDGDGGGDGGGRISGRVQAPIPSHPGIKYPVRDPPLTPTYKYIDKNSIHIHTYYLLYDIVLYIFYILFIIGCIILYYVYYRSEGRVPNGIFDPWVRWDGGLDSVRNSSAAAVAVAAVTSLPHTSLPHTSLPHTSCAAAGPRVIRASLFAHKLWSG